MDLLQDYEKSDNTLTIKTFSRTHMSKKIGLFYLLFTGLIINSYSQTDKFVPEYYTIILSDKGKEMFQQCSRPTPNNIDKFFDLTNQDIQKLEINFKKVFLVNSVNDLKIRELNNYSFQYIGVMIKNKRYIYVNAFYIRSAKDLFEHFKDWKTIPVRACDGGASFWGVLFDLEAGTFTELAINGIA